ncbi:FAD-binding oxidoreductase [Streptomyces goshikiensis]|uniref:FAD-binding oxidoreductase n=1 Tax=Streptomyces goshikiensis TaxID=1942 RepID=UPI00365C903F
MSQESTHTLIQQAVEELEQLKADVSGRVCTPGDPHYAREVSAFNLRSQIRPAFVVAAETPEDVQIAVRFAAAHGLAVGVLSTGHHAFPPQTSHGAVLITTRTMRTVRIDAATASARVGAGALWSDVVGPAQRYGLAPLNGSSAGVGVVGYTLGGGLSPVLGRAYGWAADHVRAIDVVTADGELRHVTEQSDPALFWGLRGGGSNLGIVTSLEFDLFPVTTFYGGGIFHPAEHAESVLHAYRQVVENAPDELTVSVALLNFPPIPEVPELLRGRFTVHVRVAYLGSDTEAEALIAPLRAVGAPLADTVGRRGYDTFAEVHQDPTDPAPYEDRSVLLTELTPEVVAAVLERVGPASGSVVTVLEIRQLAGALSREAGLPSAAGARDAAFMVWGATVGPPEVVEAGTGDMNTLLKDLTPWSTGRLYQNFTSREAVASDVFAPDVLARLQRIKQQYDPRNVFRAHNHNIAPTPGPAAR